MKRLAWLAILLASTGAARAATSSGSGALALAALVGQHSPVLARHDRKVLATIMGGRSPRFPAGRHIVVAADGIDCRSGDVDITAWACTLTFGARHAALSGRAAHELYATLAENGVPSDGAAGTIHEGVSHLKCAIDPGEVAQKSGGGASCSFDPGAP